jgi:hypothetical protein
MDKNYRSMEDQTDRIAQDAGLDYRSHPNTKALWAKCRSHHNALVTAYWNIKRNQRFWSALPARNRRAMDGENSRRVTVLASQE